MIRIVPSAMSGHPGTLKLPGRFAVEEVGARVGWVATPDNVQAAFAGVVEANLGAGGCSVGAGVKLVVVGTWACTLVLAIQRPLWTTSGCARSRTLADSTKLARSLRSNRLRRTAHVSTPRLMAS